MKLSKLLPIVALSGIATVATPLVVSCADNESQKTMTIKTTEGDLPEFITVNQTVELVAYDENGNPIADAEFKTNDPYDVIKIIDKNKVTGLNEGTATVLCSAPGYKDVSWICEVRNAEDYILINQKVEFMEQQTLRSNPITVNASDEYKVKLNWEDTSGIVEDAKKWTIMCFPADQLTKMSAALKTSMTATLSGDPISSEAYDVPQSSVFSPNDASTWTTDLDDDSYITLQFKFDPDHLFEGQSYFWLVVG